MKKEEIDEAIFIEIKAAQEDGVSSIDSAADMEIDVELINEIYSSPNYNSFRGVAEDLNDIEDIKQNAVVLDKGKKGFFRGTLAKSRDVETVKTEMQRAQQVTVLNNQIRASWDMINLLEKRKSNLQAEIEKMDNYIRSGLIVIEKHVEK